MAKYKGIATVTFTFEHDGTHEQALDKADLILDDILCEDYEDLDVEFEVQKIEGEEHVLKLREYPVEKILAMVPDEAVEPKRHAFTVNKVKYFVKITSDRYRLFKKNRKCVACGLEGTRLFLERQAIDDQNLAHFNLYGEEDGKLVLMTKDHIKAKSYGGANSLDNYQTMCSVCNGLKASYPLDLDGVAKLRELYKEKGEISKSQLKKALQQTRLLYLTELNGQ